MPVNVPVEIHRDDAAKSSDKGRRSHSPCAPEIATKKTRWQGKAPEPVYIQGVEGLPCSRAGSSEHCLIEAIKCLFTSRALASLSEEVKFGPETKHTLYKRIVHND